MIIFKLARTKPAVKIKTLVLECKSECNMTFQARIESLQLRWTAI